MLTNIYIRHEKYRDVCIYVPILREYNGHIKAKGTFWNMAGYDMRIGTKVDIPKDERVNWWFNWKAQRAGWRRLP